MKTKTFGDEVRERRLARGFTMRDLAHEAEMSAAYVCDIENDHRVPSEATMARIATSLNWDFEEACAAAGIVGRDAKRFLKQRPGAVRLLRRCAEFDLTDDTMAMMADMIETT